MSRQPTQRQPLAFVWSLFHRRSMPSLRWLLAGSFSLLLLIMFSLGLQAIVSERQTITALNRILAEDIGSAELSTSATQAVMRARRLEKDFLLRQNEFGFAEAKQRYLTLFRLKMRDAKSLLTQLARLTTDSTSKADAGKIMVLIDLYERDFVEVVALYQQLGFIDTGMEGELRAHAHEIEAQLNKLPSTALKAELGEMRRREKDFIIRGRDIDSQLFQNAATQFKDDIAATALSPVQRRMLDLLADDYLTSFGKFVRTNLLIEDKKRAYLTAIQSIEPLLESVTQRARHSSLRARERILIDENNVEVRIFITTVVGVLIGMLMAFFAYVRIMGTVRTTITFARRVAADDLTTRIETLGRHEFGKLDVALNQMADALLAARISQEKKAEELLERNTALADEVDLRVQAQAKLIDANKWLEKRVADRTVALSEANQELLKDIAARAKIEEALKLSEERFRHLADLSSDWYWEQDEQFRFTVISRDEGDQKGHKLSEFIGKCRWDVPTIMSESEWAAHKEILNTHQSFIDFEYRVNFSDGKFSWYSACGEPMFDGQGVFKGYRGTGKDISERKKSEEKIQHMALHDALTGLPNRLLLQDRLDQEIASASRQNRALWVLFIDLDRFKFVNDSLGHRAGDELLIIIAERLQNVLREQDTIARIGGDEFVLLLPDLAEHSLTASIIQRILSVVSEPMELEGQEIVIGCSIGISVYPGDGTDQVSLLEHADAAMYRTKKLGRNNFQFYTTAMNDGASERLDIENGLKYALANNELLLHYQPQVDLITNNIVGVEALVRWQHPTFGLIAPSRFISIAEETGLIISIGEWVLQTACTQIKAWQREGSDNLRVAVNLSSRQFADPGLLQTIIGALEGNSLSANQLDIELTESVLVTDVEHAVKVMLQLSNLGVQLSIDDFGTGYSSLMYLKRFPINILKIDQSFVQDIAVEITGEAIVASIISLAHNLKIRVIAEGVESRVQLDFLRQHRCDQVQGYYFSRPVSAEEIGAMLR